MINEIQKDLKKVISLYQEKPYLPFWGELFKITQDLKKVTHLKKQKILLYETNESVPVLSTRWPILHCCTWSHYFFNTRRIHRFFVKRNVLA